VIDYEVLKVFWWMVLGTVLVIYATTAGFDVGITSLLPFLRDETDRRVVLNISAPTWDGNLTWIVFAGGGIFVVWPLVYATAFSGLYFAMLLILFALFLRPPGYEYRSKIPSHTWRRTWDWALFISGVVPVFAFGLATANCFEGFPFKIDPFTMRIFYTGNFWGLFNLLGLLGGVVSVLMVLMHGMAYLQRRTEGHLYKKARRLHLYFATLTLVFFTLAGIYFLQKTAGYKLISMAAHPEQHPLQNVVLHAKGLWFDSFFQYPWKFFGPMMAYAGITLSIWANYMQMRNITFWMSSFGVGGVVATSGFTLFPFIMPSSTHPNESLTVWNAVSSQYALNIMAYVGTVLLLIILAYKLFAYHAIWGKKPTLTAEDIKENEHTFY